MSGRRQCSLGHRRGASIRPALAFAAAIGNYAVIRLKPGWNEPSVLWVALVAESGTLKSPVLDLALRWVRRRQAEAIDEYKRATDDLKRERDEELREGEPDESEPDEAEPAKVPPVLQRFYCSDTTVEALAPILLHNPRGVLLARDELAGWLGSFDIYKRGRADVAHWLTMHGARDLLVDRKSGEQRTIFVPRAAVSIVGSITPGGLRRALGEEHWENGLAARFLVSMPPKREKCWTCAVIDTSITDAMEQLFAKLYALRLVFDEKAQPQPVEFGLTKSGLRAWIEFYNEHAKFQVDATGHYAAVLAKIEGAAARLALMVHVVRMVSRDRTIDNSDAVDAKSIRAGVAIARWFAHEAERAYAVLTESDEDEKRRTLLEWIERKGNTVTSRQLQQNVRRFRNDSEGAEKELDGLVKRGLGHWETPHHQTGRPGRVFQRDLPPASTEPSEEPKKKGVP
jgi:hypothetical protein